MASHVELGLANAPDTPNLPLVEGLEGHGTVDSGGFPGLTANPQHTFGSSWSVRLLAAPHSVGPAVFLGSPPPTLNTYLVPPGVCGPWPLLTVWDPRFSWAHRQPSTHMWSLLECATPGRSSQCGTHGFPGLTANPHNTHLVPPGVCGPYCEERPGAAHSRRDQMCVEGWR